MEVTKRDGAALAVGAGVGVGGLYLIKAGYAWFKNGRKPGGKWYERAEKSAPPVAAQPVDEKKKKKAS